MSLVGGLLTEEQIKEKLKEIKEKIEAKGNIDFDASQLTDYTNLSPTIDKKYIPKIEGDENTINAFCENGSYIMDEIIVEALKEITKERK